jgi:hypothetical protein
MAQQFANTMAATATARERRGAAERQMQFRQLVGSEGFDAGNPEHIRAAAALDPAGAEALGRSFTTRRAADQDFDRNGLILARELSLPVRDDPSFQRWLQLVEDNINPEWAAMIREASPTYNEGYMTQLRMAAEDYVNKRVSTPTSSVQFTPGGDAFEVNVGGIGNPTAREVIVTSRNGAPPTSTAGTPAAGTPAAETVGPARDGMGPQELIAADIPAENVPTGSPTVPPTPALTPASAGGGMGGVQPLDMQTASLIIQNAVQNRVIDPTHLQQLREMVGPENERNLAAWMQQHQIRIQPPGEAPIQPGMRSAEYRPDMAPAPQFQQVQSVNQVGTQFRGRDPMQSPAPGSDLISIERSAARAGAEAGAAAGARGAVDVQTAAPIAAGRGEAERIVRLRERVPDLRGDAEAAVANINRRINDIDRFLRHPYRFSIIGPVEGNLPRLVQFGSTADVQALWDTIKDNEVLRSIVETRAQTQTGGSVVGPVSNSDLQLLIRASSPLSQTGEPSTQDDNMRRLRNELYNARTRIMRRYEDTIRPLGREAQDYRLDVDAVPPTYTRTPPSTRNRPRGGNRPATPSRTNSGAAVVDWPNR